MPVIADISYPSDNQKEYIIGTKSGIYVWSKNGQPFLNSNALFFSHFNATYGNYDKMDSPPVVADLDNDPNHKKEILCVSIEAGDPASDTYVAHVFALNNQGQTITNWLYDDHTFYVLKAAPGMSNDNTVWLPSLSVGDVNNDGYLEVFIADNNYIYGWDHTGSNLPHFPIHYIESNNPSPIECRFITPLLADVDGNDDIEIIVASNSANGGIYAFKNDGSLLTGWPLTCGKVEATPCIDDIDNDGKNEIIATSGGTVYAWDCEGSSRRILWGKNRLNEQNNAAFENSCQSANLPPVTINSNVIWNNYRFQRSDVTIGSGGILTIRGRVEFSFDVGITVEPGGELIIDGGYLTTTCSSPWKGILVNGNPDLLQRPYSNQGFLYVTYGTIENANPAVKSVNGGIVIANDAVFRNNIRSVVIKNYLHTNLSAFTRCTFQLSDLMTSLNNQSFLDLESVKRIKVNGCTFENNLELGNIGYNHRGVGIYCNDADLFVGGASPEGIQIDPPPINTVFKNLFYGIFASRSGATQNTILIYQNTRFENNLRGLYLGGYNGPSYEWVTDSKFKLLPSDMANGLLSYGMYLNDCSGYTVEENEFYNDQTEPDGIGLIINESGGENNEIYNNKFHNLEYGANAQGANRDGNTSGLCFKCNDFFDNDNDITVVANNEWWMPPNQGIPNQGSADLAAKNTFTLGNENGNFFDIFNDFNPSENTIEKFNYYVDETHPNDNVVPDPINHYNGDYTVYLQTVNGTYNKTHDCPSQFGGGMDEMRLKLTQTQIKSDSIEQLLFLLTDGGSTENLANEVQMSTPPEALETRNELLDQSPYLSDSVMKTAIAKEDVLPNSMIRDVLVENPQSAKSGEILNAIDQRFIPMPDSMMSQILEGQNILGAKEIQENQLLSWNQRNAVALKYLIYLFNEDTTGAYGTDSIIPLLNQDGSLNAKYDLISLYFSKGLFQVGDAILEEIPVNYDLSNQEVATYNKFVTLLPILEQIDTSINGIESLDSVQIAELFSLAENDMDLPGGYARNLLVMSGNSQYDEPIIFPVLTKGSEKWHKNDPSQRSYNEYWLKVFPNPAKSYCIVEYRLKKNETLGTTCMISIKDIYGRAILNYLVKREFDQIVIPIQNLADGLYVISLQLNGRIVDQFKETIIK